MKTANSKQHFSPFNVAATVTKKQQFAGLISERNCLQWDRKSFKLLTGMPNEDTIVSTVTT